MLSELLKKKKKSVRRCATHARSVMIAVLLLHALATSSLMRPHFYIFRSLFA